MVLAITQLSGGLMKLASSAYHEDNYYYEHTKKEVISILHLI